MDFQEYYERKAQSPQWLQYCRLMAERPDLFRQSELLRIETDLAAICRFEMEHDRTIGVVYRSPYSMMVVDLVSENGGPCFCYERVVATASQGAVVSVPVYEGKFVLLRQYRHALRDHQLAFPRGFGEEGMTVEENLCKEIQEEIGAQVLSSRHIGKIACDSGLSSNLVDAYFCEVTKPQQHVGYEGIMEMQLVTPDEMKEWIAAGKITDGYTLSAFAMLLSQQDALCDMTHGSDSCN